VLAGDLGMAKLRAPIPFASNQNQFNQVEDPTVPVLVMDDQPLENYFKPVPGKSLAFKTVNAGHPCDVILRPFYQMYYQRYTVYWKTLTPAQWREQPDK
jgi:hypothetical protein